MYIKNYKFVEKDFFDEIKNFVVYYKWTFKLSLDSAEVLHFNEWRDEC